MSAELDAFRDEMNTETSRIGDDVKAVAQKLADAIAAGDLHAIQELRPAVDALHAAGDELHALAAPADQPATDQPV